MKKVWITVADFSHLTVVKKIVRAREVKAAMTSNAYFPNPDPSLPDLGNKAQLLEDAKIAADTGDHAAVANMHKVEGDLDIMMRNEANYVEKIANADFDNGETIIKSATFRPQKVTVRTPRVFKAKNTKTPGEVKLSVAKEKQLASYTWQSSTSATGAWITAGTTTNKASIIISGLESGARMYFRMAVIIGGSQGAFTEVISIIVL